MRTTLAAMLWAILQGAVIMGQPAATVDFRRDVQPILRLRCVGCHGPAQQMRGLRLDRRSSTLRVGTGGTNVAPGSSEGSRLFLRLTGSQFGPQMPPTGGLSSDEINIIKAWIDQGAEWPDDVAGETPPSRPDPRATAIMEALRRGDRADFKKRIADPAVVNLKGPGGSTPLMYAVLYGDPESVGLLLDQGADPNASNDAGATALIWAVDDLDKTRILLEYGADPNVRSDEGLSPLLVAARWSGSTRIVRLLLDYGAETSVRSPDGATALAAATAVGNDSLMRMLLQTRTDWVPLPLAIALRARCDDCFDMLLKNAARDDLDGALMAAARRSDSRAVKLLLDRGAIATANVLRVAAGSEAIPADIVELLIDRGADVNEKSADGETPLDAAKRHGESAVVSLLIKAGAREGQVRNQPAPTPKPAASARAALERSLPLLQRADVAFIKKSGCVSCHNNSLTEMTLAVARKNGWPINDPIAQDQLHTIGAFLESNRERALQGTGIPGGLDTVGYTLLGLAAESYRPDAATDVWARYLKNLQSSDGRWAVQAQRPPIESSDFQTTATAMRVLQAYGIKTRRPEYDRAVQRAVEWLQRAQPRTTEDRAFHLLGLQWGGGNRDVIRNAARDLLIEQRPDGGWGQLSSLPSDAYATGQALVALKDSGALTPADAAYRRAVQFLLSSQLEDGSWYVRTRAVPVQPYFDSDFPHGHDQFISVAATNWAAMALAAAAH